MVSFNHSDSRAPQYNSAAIDEPHHSRYRHAQYIPPVEYSDQFVISEGLFGSKTSGGNHHECPHCEYSSASIKLIRGHMVKHGPCRIECGYCDYRGHYPSTIRKHSLRHHPQMPFR